MTEQEWLGSTYPMGMVKLLLIRALTSLTPRKVRLFRIACCRRTSARLPPVFFDLLSDVERQVDNLGITGELPSFAKASQDLELLGAADRDSCRPGVAAAAVAV